MNYMSSPEQSPLPFAEFLRYMRETDPTMIGDMAVALYQATLNHQEMKAKTYWLINNGGLFNSEIKAENPKYREYDDSVRELAGKLEIHGDEARITEIIRRYENMTPVGENRRGEA
jgi:hypothetical protein